MSEHVKNPAAVALGRLAKGKAKTVSPASIIARRQNLEIARAMLERKRLDSALKP